MLEDVAPAVVNIAVASRCTCEVLLDQLADVDSSNSRTSPPGARIGVMTNKYIEGPWFTSTGTTIKIVASKKLSCVPAKAVKDALNG